MNVEKPKDRIDLLKQLCFIGGDEAVNVFSSYIPDHYNEIYTLYGLLESLKIDYNNIRFMKPKDHKESFVFLCEFNIPSDKDKITAYLADHANKIQFMRKNPYLVFIKDQNDCTNIKFKHL